mgnify:FL=1
MSKKVKSSGISFDTGIPLIIPSTQEAFKDGNRFSNLVRKEEGEQLQKFKKILGDQLGENLKNLEIFPSQHEIFIFIMQFFKDEKEYRLRDVDNMAKTILDVLKSKVYHDDGQVRTLLVGKKIHNRVPQNFAYIAITELKSDRDVDALRDSGLERSITLFQELRSKNII